MKNNFWAYKDVLVDSNSPLAMTKSNLNTDYPRHSHDFIELVFILEGSGTHKFNNISHQLLPGMVFVVKPGDYHGYFDNNQLFLMNVIMYGLDMLSLLQDLKGMEGFHFLFMEDISRDGDYINFHQLTAAELMQARKLLEMMEQEYEERLPGYQANLKSVFLNLCVMVMRSYEHRGQQNDTSTAKLGRALAYMEKNFYRNISIPEIADQAYFSLRQFQRIFSTKYGMSPVQYLLNLRIQAASYHLLNSEASISQIAELCGFEDSNYFSRQFKKVTGRSPREYRASAKTRNAIRRANPFHM